ncbi:MAG: peptidoglycan-binding protein [Candidatus Omnitrophica bacterium]|nr:peptidoglycan-binding protein [Candidatus Omnitrophota bacterium]
MINISYKSRYFYIVVLIASFFIAGCGSLNGFGKEAKEEKKIFGALRDYDPKIETIQWVLKKAGFNPGETDGRMGWQTREAIKQFQKANKLKASGFIDNATKEKMTSLEETVFQPKLNKDIPAVSFQKAGTPAAKTAESEIAFTKSYLESPLWIKKIQQALKNLGFDPGAIDGKMGGKTRRAVAAFQKSKGLKADGIIGRETWKELSKYFPKERG